MKTWQKAFAVFGGLALAGAGCGAAAPTETTVVTPAELPENFVTYTGDSWSIGHSTDWQAVQNPDDAGQTFFIAPFVESADEFEHSVSVTVTPGTESIPAAEMAEQLGGFLTQLGASAILESGTVDIPQGEAAKVSYTVVDPVSGDELYGTQVGLFDDTTLYVMTFTATEVGRDAFTADFEAMYNSFRAL